MYYTDNKTAKTCKTVGWLIIIFGVLCALILGAVYPAVTIEGKYYTHAEKSYNWALALGGSAACGVSGLLMLGIGEIIFLLEDIKRSIKESGETAVATLKKLEIEGKKS